jgi:hypothetical protein
MTHDHAPRLALTLLRWFSADSTALEGDLIEEYQARHSRTWFYWQILAAIWIELSTRPEVIRPLQLVDLQPVDAVERSRRMSLRFRPVNLTASPLYGAGGLGLVLLSLLMTLVVPAVWLVLVASMLAGVGVGVVMIVIHQTRRSEMSWLRGT